MQKEEGIVKIPSHHSVDETVDKLRATQSKGVMLFALIDHGGRGKPCSVQAVGAVIVEPRGAGQGGARSAGVSPQIRTSYRLSIPS